MQFKAKQGLRLANSLLFVSESFKAGSLCISASPRAQMVMLVCSTVAEVDCNELAVQMMPKSSAVY